MLDAISQLTSEVRNKARLMIGRCVLAAVKDGGKIQLVQAQLLDGETHDDVERVQQYGFTSVPDAGAEGVIVFVGGNRDHGVLIATDDRRYRPTGLAAGEVAVYSKWGDKVVFRQGEIEISHATKVKITAPLVQITGNLTVGGTIVATGNVTGAGKSLSTHTHSGVQPGGGNTGAPN